MITNDKLVAHESKLIYKDDRFLAYAAENCHNITRYNQNQYWYVRRNEETLPFVVYDLQTQQSAILTSYDEIHKCGYSVSKCTGPIWVQTGLIRHDNLQDLVLLQKCAIGLAQHVKPESCMKSQNRIRLYQRLEKTHNFRDYEICKDLDTLKYGIHRDWITQYANAVNYKLDWYQNPSEFHDPLVVHSAEILCVSGQWKMIGFASFNNDGVVTLSEGCDPSLALWMVFSCGSTAVLTDLEHYVALEVHGYNYNTGMPTKLLIGDQKQAKVYSTIDRDILTVIFERRLQT